MLSILSYPCRSYLQSCTDNLVNEAFRNSSRVFSIHFNDNVNAKIYFFVLVNKKLLFHDYVSMQIRVSSFESGQDEFEAAKIEFVAAIEHKRKPWQEAIRSLMLTLGCEIALVMQGIKTESKQDADFFIPAAITSCNFLGFSFCASTRSGGGLIAQNEIKQTLNHRLVQYGIPLQLVTEILNQEMHAEETNADLL